jgi:hypothetical protein
VDACEPPGRLLVVTKGYDEPFEQVIDVMLASDGDGTTLVLEERGMPLDLVAAFGAGIQVHVEDLAGHIAGRERRENEGRWGELFPAYQALAANLG